MARAVLIVFTCLLIGLASAFHCNPHSYGRYMSASRYTYPKNPLVVKMSEMDASGASEAPETKETVKVAEPDAKGTEVVPEPEAMDAEVVVEASKSTIPETVAEAPEIKIPEPEPEPEPEAAKVAEVVGVSTGSSAIVVVDKETIEVSSGVAGLVAGTIIGGPVVGVLLSVASNYASKKDTDVGEAARGVGKLALDSLNFLGGLAIKYEVAEKVNKAASDTFQKLKEAEGTDKELIEKVEQSFKTTSDKLAELDEEYDLKGLAGEAMKKSGDLATELVEKAIEIDQKEKFSQRLTTWLKKIVDQEMV